MSGETKTIVDRFDLQGFIGDLVGDLRELRAGKLSVREAHARAELARQVLRGVHYVVMAQRYLEGRALPAPTPGAAASPNPVKGRGLRRARATA